MGAGDVLVVGPEAGRVVDLPVSLHNFPKTIMQLAGLPPRPDWVSGQILSVDGGRS